MVDRQIKPRHIEKGWGEEIIFANGVYAGKLLVMAPYGKMSMHHHRVKHETWYIVSGEVRVDYYDADGNEIFQYLFEGDAWINPVAEPHRLSNVKDQTAVILEASTYDSPDDNIRTKPGDSQRKRERAAGQSLSDGEQAKG